METKTINFSQKTVSWNQLARICGLSLLKTPMFWLQVLKSFFIGTDQWIDIWD